MTDRELMAEAVGIMLSAINSGDWKVDGACDPHASIIRLKNRLSKPEYEFECPRCGHCCQQREWVSLEDHEIYEYADRFLYQHGSNYGIKSFGKAIEAKLKEKNT
jgi:hypothetical protein